MSKFDFKDSVKTAARLRQNELCALDGLSLTDEFENAHHVAPKQVGDEKNESHNWIAEEINCVVLCEQCHKVAHEDAKWKKGTVAPPTYFPYSHGGDKKKHGAWATELQSRIDAL